MLAATGILTDRDAEAIGEGLLTVLSEIEAGGFPFRIELEDIHMNVEARLKEMIGEPARAPAHGPQPQRPGGDRFPPLGARPVRRGHRRASRR